MNIKILTILLIFAFLLGCQTDKTNSGAESVEKNAVKNTGENSVSNDSDSSENKQISDDEEAARTASGGKSEIESIYTDLDDKKCETVESNVDEGGFYIGECGGVAGYKIELTAGDARENINLIAPNGKKLQLDFNRVSAAFSEVGDKAEWRVKDKKPFALIVRFDAFEDNQNPDKRTSRLIVSKITDSNACITDVVEPVANANEKARQLADASADKPCKFK